jgi:pimeloyl-ACP methyl ester carboxylesterase
MRTPSRTEALVLAGLAGAAATNAYLTAQRADRDSKKRRAASESGRPVTVLGADGTHRYVRVHGSDDLPTLVLIHGWVETSELWHRQVRDLADEFRIVTYDHRGHGLSDPARDDDYSLEALAADLDLVLEATATNGELPLLAGHSMGAMTIAAWGQANRGSVSERIRGAAFISTGLEDLNTESAVIRPLPGPFGTAQGKLADAVLASPGSIRSVPLPIARAVVAYVALAPHARDEDIELVLRMALDCRQRARTGCAIAMSRMQLLGELDALDVPAVNVAGELDRLTPVGHAERIDQALPHSVGLYVSPTSGHTTPLEDPDLVAEALRDLAAASGGGRLAGCAGARTGDLAPCASSRAARAFRRAEACCVALSQSTRGTKEGEFRAAGGLSRNVRRKCHPTGGKVAERFDPANTRRVSGLYDPQPSERWRWSIVCRVDVARATPMLQTMSKGRRQSEPSPPSSPWLTRKRPTSPMRLS